MAGWLWSRNSIMDGHGRGKKLNPWQSWRREKRKKPGTRAHPSSHAPGPSSSHQALPPYSTVSHWTDESANEYRAPWSNPCQTHEVFGRHFRSKSQQGPTIKPTAFAHSSEHNSHHSVLNYHWRGKMYNQDKSVSVWGLASRFMERENSLAAPHWEKSG